MSPKSKKTNLNPIRESLINSLERAKSLIERRAKELTVSELETRAAMIDSVFSQLNTIQSDIEQAGEQHDFNTRQVYEDLYCDVKSRFVRAISAHHRRTSSSGEFVHNSTALSHNNSSGLARNANLPKIRIPEFSGKYTEWTNWYNTFCAFIDSDHELDSLSKFVHLRSALGPIPLRAIEALELTAENYPKALKLLKDRFENKAIIFQAHMKELFEMPKIARQNASCLRELIDRVNGHLCDLNSFGSKEDVANVAIYYLIRSKVDPETLKRWEDSFKCDELPTWQLFSSFLSTRCTTLENRELNMAYTTASSNDKGKKHVPVSLAAQQSNQGCPTCNGPHKITKCPIFMRLTPNQRYFEAKKYSLCILCLTDNHSVPKCKASYCNKCQGRHHAILHRDNKQAEPLNAPAPSNDNTHTQQHVANPAQAEGERATSNCVYNSVLEPTKVKFLATAVLLVRNSKGEYVECRALLDSGSQLNFISQDLARDLSLKIKPSKEAISGIGCATTDANGSVTTVIKSRLTNFTESLNFLLLPSITQYAPNVPIDVNQWQLPKNLQLADPKFNESRAINMLLGVSTFFKLLSVGQITLGANMPILQKSLLGWLLAGEMSYPSNSPTIHVANSAVKDYVLSQQIERFWTCEDYLPSNSQSPPEDEICENHFLTSVSRMSSGRIMVRLPFKPKAPGVGGTYSTALKRFKNLECKLVKNPDLKLEYVKFINEYRELNHLEKVPSTQKNNVQFIMPHHAVLRPESLSTKLRVVFDASCKSENGFSLNDNLLVGPRIQSELFDILVRFRLFRYAITADISKMYRQILVHPDDCNWQCILWREDSSENVDILRLKTVTYGTNAAPYLAVRCLKFLADTYKLKFPLGSQVLNNNFYMDDMLAGADSIEGLVSLKREVAALLKLGQFELHKWRASSPLTGEKLTGPLVSEPLEIPTEDCIKTLGVLWFSEEDTFSFAYSGKNHNRITKRTVLSELASLFDPLGLINPIVVLGKIFLQELWMLKLEWDEALPQGLHDKWQRYRQELPVVSTLKVPRYIADLFSAESVELHGFADASNRAYGCAIYLRAVDAAGKVTVNLLTAKSRVAPLKVVSLPRLELQAAVMLVQLSDRVTRSCALNFTVVNLWTDSLIVLHWLSAHPSRWTTFVANRVALIQGLSQFSEWRKIDTKANPADIVSRGMLPTDLGKCSLWFKGPDFLSLDRSCWPSQPHIPMHEEDMKLEQRRTNYVLLGRENLIEDLISNCKFVNSFVKLNRVFALMFRWLNKARSKLANVTTKKCAQLSVCELRMGLNYILFNVQQTSFNVECNALKQNLRLKSVRIQSLNPFIDESYGFPIIRVGGRLSKSNLPYYTKHPILLPYNHPFTESLAAYLHKINLHVGPLTLLAAIRQRFWIINGRRLTQKIVRHCISCFRNHPKPLEQRMGDLPRDRIVGKMYPFQKTGMDFAGPILIHFKLRGKRPVKAYLALFICFLTKACHLEVVSDLSTPAFLCALRRFFARRGLSSDLYCDNATNFTGAARELKTLIAKSFDDTAQTTVRDECAARGVNFHFIPPRSPHMGGLWESAIKVAKSMLVHYINGATLTFEELTTVTTEVEGIMNSRPLYPMSSDPNDFEALTPGHFLIGRPLNSFPDQCSDEEIKIPPVNRWKRIQHIKTSFWHRWSKEYLLSLQQRNKWRSSCSNVKRDTLVLIADDNLPPGKWRLGRVENVILGEDGLARVVSIRTGSGNLKRNITKICPLPINSESGDSDQHKPSTL